MAGEAIVLIVPGLRLPLARSVAPMWRDDLDCLACIEGIEETVAGIDRPITLVARRALEARKTTGATVLVP